MSDQSLADLTFVRGKTYEMVLGLPVQLAQPAVRALGPQPSPAGFAPNRIGKVLVHQATLGAVTSIPFSPDRQDVILVFEVLENPLPLLALLAIFAGAAAFLTISGAFLVRNVRELVKTPAGTAVGLGALLVAGIVGVAVLKGGIR